MKIKYKNNSITVLYIGNNKKIENILKAFNFNVISFKEVETGLKFFKSSNMKINLLITNLELFIMNSIEIAEIIKLSNKKLPIIISINKKRNLQFLEKFIKLNINSHILYKASNKQIKKSIKKAIESNIIKDKFIENNNELNQEIEKNKKKHQIMIRQSKLAAMGEMINIIAHEWRQPLACIGTAAFNIKYQIKTNSNKLEDTSFINPIVKKIDEIEGFVQTLSTTVDDFMNFFSSDKIITKSNINLVIKDIVNFMNTSTFKTSNITIKESFFSENQIEIYKNELEHVILNILKNAYDKLLENKIKSPQIIIKTYDIKKTIQIDISDNGGKIEDSLFNKIFDPYFTTKKNANGVGLGLYFSKIIIEKHHKGELNVYNTEDGVCFRIKLNSKI